MGKVAVMAGFALLKNFPSISRNSCKVVVTGVRNISYDENDHRVVGSSDGKVVICWHPEKKFPYDKSLPVNKVIKESLSPLKVQNLKEVLSIFHPKKEEFVRRELMNITFTTKHRWFPEGIHKRRRKRNFEVNRPYL